MQPIEKPGAKRKILLARKLKNLYRTDFRWYPMILIPVVGTFVFAIYPFFLTIIKSFYNYGFTRFVGLNNYFALFRDREFVQSIGNTLVLWAMVLPTSMVFTFSIASLLNQVKKLANFYKSLFLLPMIYSSVGAVLILRFIFMTTENGLFNYLIGLVGIGPIPWFLDPFWARVLVIINGLWLGSGFSIILFLSALQSIPLEMYEAAEIDGASSFQSWLFITIPSLTGVFKFMFITGTIASFSRFSDVYTLSMGLASQRGPNNVYQTIAVYILRYLNPSFETIGNYSIGVSASVILFFLTIAITASNFTLLYSDIKGRRAK